MTIWRKALIFVVWALTLIFAIFHPKMANSLVLLALSVTVFIIFSCPSPTVDPEILRQDKLRTLAKKVQLQFKPDRDSRLADQYFALTWMQHGEMRYAYNVFRGHYSGHEVLIFDYRFTVIASGSRGSPASQDYYYSVYILQMKGHFPKLIITRENLGSRLIEALIKPDIHFESSEFSKGFRVRSDDRKFGYDVCNPRMMEYLLTNKDLNIEIEGSTLAIMFETWLHPADVEKNISRLIQLRKLMPDFLFT